jgi:lysozyme
MNVDDLIALNECDKYNLYEDTAGKRSIGRGRNLDDVGISHDELLLMYSNDKARAVKTIMAYPWFPQLSQARQAACIDLAFNLGATKLRGFVRFASAMQAGNFELAAAELKDSKLYNDAPKRTTRNINLIRNEEWLA